MILLPAQAVTQQEMDKISNHLETTCTNYKTYCNVVFINSSKVQAYTMPNGKILITTGLANKLSYNELLSIGYHEVGHRALNHVKRFFSYYYNSYPVNTTKLRQIRHTHEFEADIFSCLVDKKYNNSCHLPQALLKITKPEYRNYSSKTHPSITTRIELLKEFK